MIIQTPIERYFFSLATFREKKIFFVTRLFIFIKCVYLGSIWLNSLQALVRSIMAGDQIVIPAQKPPNTSCFMAQKKSQIFSLYTVCTKKQIPEKISFLIQMFLFLQFLTDFDHPGTNRKVFISSCYFSRDKNIFRYATVHFHQMCLPRSHLAQQLTGSSP